ncbi:MAG: hypothetical protein EAZ55_10220 [Cytophagales bacterium]|nr:MAG: hypothetical protein EAZ55_10220 [Cytophagales bacterium]
MSQISNNESRIALFLGHLFNLNVLRRLQWGVISIGIYTTSLIIIFSYWQIPPIKMSNVIHSLLGVALGLLLVFRTNTAYERWWEGRRLLGGLNNNMRNLAIKIYSYFLLPEQRKHLVGLCTAYSFALRNHLRDNPAVDYAVLLNEEELKLLNDKQHKPNHLAKRLSLFFKEQHEKGHISEAQLLNLDKHLSEFTDIIGGCERIKRTPMPLAYSVHLNQFLILYLISLPFVFLHELGYWSGLVLAFIYYALAGLKLIGEEIEDPFGTDVNDLPMDVIVQNIFNNLYEIVEIEKPQL